MNSHAVHVYQPGNIPPYAENTPAAQYVVYGQDIPEETVFGDAFIHDPTVDPEQGRWMVEDLLTRLKKGGNVRHLESPSPMSGPKVSSR